MFELDKLIRLVRLLDRARAAHHGGDADALEQPGLGAVGDLAHAVVAGQRAHQLRDGGLLAGVEAGRGGQLVDLDARAGKLALHAGQQLALHVGADAFLHLLRRHAGQVAEFVSELAGVGDGVHRDAARDLVGGDGGVGHVVELIEWPFAAPHLRQVADVADQPRRVLDGVAALRGERRMRRLAVHAAAVGVQALVRHHRPHRGRLANDATIDADAAPLQLGQHEGRAQA